MILAPIPTVPKTTTADTFDRLLSHHSLPHPVFYTISLISDQQEYSACTMSRDKGNIDVVYA